VQRDGFDPPFDQRLNVRRALVQSSKPGMRVLLGCYHDTQIKGSLALGVVRIIAVRGRSAFVTLLSVAQVGLHSCPARCCCRQKHDCTPDVTVQRL
jgi:hypothetical protein